VVHLRKYSQENLGVVGDAVILQGAMLGPMKTAARIAAVLGAAGSAAFYLRASQSTPPLLRVILLLWVLLPFVGARTGSKRWGGLFDGAVLVVTLISLVFYGADLRPTGAPAGFLFVCVPLASWVLLGGAALHSIRRLPR
jgi:hypothetical protein